MHIPQHYSRVRVITLLIFACIFFQRCKDQDAIAPQEDQAIANNDVPASGEEGWNGNSVLA